MVITKETNLLDIDLRGTDEQISITKDVVLDYEKLLFILAHYSGKKISILSGYDNMHAYSNHDCLYNESEVVTLAQNINTARQEFGKDIDFDGEFSVEQALTASRKINAIVHEIESTTHNGKPLSPFEKFLMAYEYVVEKAYTMENPDESPSLSRNVISVLNGDKIVCAGYANFLAVLLNRLGIPCITNTVIAYNSEDNEYGNHAVCTIRMEDPKYKLKGVFYSDPTKDSAPINRNIVGLASYNHCLIPYRYIKYYYDHPIVLNRAMLINQDPQNFRSVKTNSIPKPPVLSYLFPEKTGGKSQDVLLREQAEQQLQDSGFYDTLDYFVEDIDQKQIDNSVQLFVKKLLNPMALIHNLQNRTIHNHLGLIVQNLTTLGFSLDEIKTLCQHHFSKDILIETLKERYDADSLRTKAVFTLYDRDEKLILDFNSKLDSMIDKIKIPNKKINTENVFENLSKKIATSLLYAEFNGHNQTVDIHQIQALLNQGMSLKEIKFQIKKHLINFDFQNTYLEYSGEFVHGEYQTNEQELYLHPVSDPYAIYNVPYIEDFEKLKKSAKLFTNEDIFKAYINIFEARGFDFATAQNLSCLALRQTDIINPKEWT